MADILNAAERAAETAAETAEAIDKTASAAADAAAAAQTAQAALAEAGNLPLDGTHTSPSIIDVMLDYLTFENIAMQVAVVAVALLLGWFLARRLHAYVVKRFYADVPVPETPSAPQAEESILEAQMKHFRRFLVSIVRNVAFSAISWGFVLLGAYSLVEVFGYDPNSLVLCRIFMHVLFAFAVLSFFTAFFDEFVTKKRLSKHFRKGVAIVFWVLVALHFFGILDVIVATLETTKLPIGSGNVTLWACLIAVINVLITLAVAEWLASITDALVRRTQISSNLKIVLARVIRIALFVVAVIIALSSVGIDLTVLSVFSGALGVGLGFGLQKIASNYISGFIILLDRSLKIDDMVEVAGFKGRITQINTRYTVVRSSDGIECIVPNENFVTSTVKNYSYTDEASTVYVAISVAYDADVKRALEIMLEEGSRERPRIAKGRKPWAYVEGFGASGIDLKLAFWCTDPKNGTAGLRTEVALAIFDRFVEEKIEVPYNRLELDLRYAETPLRVMRVDAPSDQAKPVPADAPAAEGVIHTP